MTKKLKKDFLASFYFFSLQEDEEEERIFLKKKHFLSNWQAATDSPFTFHNLTAKITSRLIMWVLTSLETDDAVDLLQMTTPEAIWRFKTTPTPTTSISRSRSLSSSWPSLLSLLSSWRHCRRCRRRGVTAVVASLPSLSSSSWCWWKRSRRSWCWLQFFDDWRLNALLFFLHPLKRRRKTGFYQPKFWANWPTTSFCRTLFSGQSNKALYKLNLWL